jgi:prevent-host-death family protein
MKRVSVTDLKNKLSQYLRLVKEGETIEVMERSVPIARLQGIPKAGGDDAHLDRLVRDGIVSKARRKPDRTLVKEPPIPSSGDIVEALIQERGDR